jgi:hypothetical protein
MEEKTILLGKVDEIVYTLTFDGITVSHKGYKDIFDYDQGEQRARDSLESEGEYFWKEAVAADRTTQGLEDYIQEILDVDGWEHVLGDDNIQEIDNSGLYVETYNLIEDDELPYDQHELYDDILIEKEDFDKLVKAIEESNTDELRVIFGKYPEFKAREDLKQYV